MKLAEIKNEQRVSQKRLVNVGNAFRALLLQALQQNRITYGAVDCAYELNSHPEKVMICVLAGPAASSSSSSSSSSNAFSHTQTKLIEAYCREHHIRIIQVSNPERILKIILNFCNYPVTTDHISRKTCLPDAALTEFSCILIHKPSALSSEDDFILTYHDFIVYCKVFPYPAINIPE
ncbi:hypothetical protein CHS0354_042206 [Potamilus streckersoni]|uniref:Ribosomal protein eL8/eL30/eS12/Gadd45 domain-containing protein n=1 Tax=Potamilus streckersoni TaxID=2493646 RepID=A0AAE0TLQ3_9BIVA|nr:hypothetical protein CHS0354_042206 [Potamilus streckersoni]